MSTHYRFNKKKFLTRLFILVLIIAAIVLCVNMFNSPKVDTKSSETEATNSNNNDASSAESNDSKTADDKSSAEIDNSKNTESASVKEDTNKPKKIDFLANLKVPVYKKSEKDIKIPILIYHAFFTPELEDDEYNLSCTQDRFDETIKIMLDNGYTFITLEDLYKYNNGEIGLPEKVMIITMDDGWLGNYTDAFPVLKKYNVPATIFIVNTLVGTEDYFSWDQAKEMYDSGLVKIHCHGYKHIAYGDVSKDTLVSDYTKSHQEIEEHLGEKIQKIMAYPAGNSSAESIKWLKEVGFEVQVQTKYGTVNKSRNLDLTDLGRIRAEKASANRILSTINSAGV